MTDAAGMLRHVDDAKRLAALALVREGRLFDLGRVLDESVPVFPGRYFRQTLVTTAHHANGAGVGDNRVNWITEIVSGTQQLGTHLDALSHLQEGDRAYGGVSVAELAGDQGVRQLGVETVPQIVTCGWLVDAPGVGPGDVIGPEHLDGVEPEPGDAVLFHTGWGEHWTAPETYLSGEPGPGREHVDGVEPEPGDAVLFHTGWGEHWTDPDTYLSGEPGPGLELAEWLAARGVALTGCDTWSYGPVPAEDPDRPFEVPQRLNVRHGVFVVENLDLSELAAAGVRRFALVLTHAKLRGATGAWTSPIALA